MPDSPDYQKYLLTSVRFSLQDLSEVAARLGSPDVYDRRGEVCWMDVMNKGLGPYNKATSGANSSVVVDILYPEHGGYSLRIRSGAVATDYAHVYHETGVAVSGRLGMETSFRVNQRTAYIVMNLTRAIDAGQQIASVRIDATNNAIDILDQTNTWQVLYTNAKLGVANLGHYSFKFVIDFATGKYVRVMLNNLEVDASAYSFQSAGALSSRKIAILFGLDNSQVATGDVWLQHILLTGAEP